MMDSSGEPSLTLDEALKEIEELENVSNAVLGASDPSNCSYSKVHLLFRNSNRLHVQF